MAIGKESFASGRFALDVDNYNVGFISSFSGLNMTAELHAHNTGPDNVVKKQISVIKPSPGKAKIGIGMGKGMYTWIRDSFMKSAQYRSGMLTSANFDYKAQSTLTFTDALITSVTVPKLDASSTKEAAYFDVEWDATSIRWAKAGGESIQSKFGAKQKAWTCANFALEIDGLPTKSCNSIDSFTWKQGVTRDHTGALREHRVHPTKVEVPDIKFSLSYREHDEWAKAAHDWFHVGNTLEQHERNGRIVFLSPDLGKELGHIELKNCGFLKFEDGERSANADNIMRFNVTMYVEQMVFQLNEVDA